MVSCLKLTFNFVTNRNVHSIFTYLPCNLKVILCKTDIYFHLPKQIIIFSDFKFHILINYMLYGTLMKNYMF